MLADLSRDDYRRIRPHLTSVALSFADVLGEPDARIKHVYFPTSGLIAVLTATAGGMSLALVGKEGMVGSSVGAGVGAPLSLILVQGDGTAMRMDAGRFDAFAERSVSLQRQIHRYTCGLLKRALQVAVCNGFHGVEARLARCLLEASDQVKSDEIRITQQSLAYIMSAHRSGVSIAATSMRRAKLIEYARGRLRIINRKGLARLACACYDV